MDRNPPDGFEFDEKRGERHIEFIERFCKAQQRGNLREPSIRLELFQKAKLQLVFGWIEADTGNRRFREIVDIRGRKCGKSTETAAVEWDVAVNDHESGAEIYCTANKKDQAKLIFDEVVNMRAAVSGVVGYFQKAAKRRLSAVYIQCN